MVPRQGHLRVRTRRRLLADLGQIAAPTVRGDPERGDPAGQPARRRRRPIAKGRLGKPVEFGHKAQLADNEDGVILNYTLEQGNPADAPQVAPPVARITRRTGRAPRAVTAARGYGEQKVDDTLRELGVRTVVIPRKGKPGKDRQAKEHRPAFRRTVQWRTGIEGRISTNQTRLRLGPHPHRRHRRSPDLGRTRSPGPQPGQDQRLGSLTDPRRSTPPTTIPTAISGLHSRRRFRSK